MGTELTECFFQMRISPRLRKLCHDSAAWWSKFGLNAEDYLGLCTTLLGQIFGEQIFTCITETDTIFPLQVREPSLTTHFQKYMTDLVGGWRSMCAMDSAGSPQPRRSNATEINNDDVLSLASDDAAPSSSGLISQRCTVIAASPSKRNLMGSSRLEPESALGVSVDKELCFSFPDTLRINQHRALPDPIAFIHVDLPLFPLSAFAPLSHRNLPSPLRTSPKVPTINPVPFLECTRLEELCQCCICPTSTMSGHLTPANSKSQIVSSDVANNSCTNGMSGFHPSHRDGLATLLMEEEKELRPHLFGRSPCAIQSEELQERNARNSLQLFSEPLSLRQTLNHNKTSLSTKLHTFFMQLFCRTNCPSERQPSVLTVVKHLGRVYHPAVITLLMHARDREHSPLDLSHPTIQAAVSSITTPQREFAVLQRIRGHIQEKDLPPCNPSYRSQRVLSVESELVTDQRAQRSFQSVVTCSFHEPTKPLLPKERFYRSAAANNRSSVVLDVRASQLALLPLKRSSVIETPDSFGSRQSDGKLNLKVGALYRQSAISEPGPEGDQFNPPESRCGIDWQDVQVFVSRKPATEGHWSEFGPLTCMSNGQNESGGTPTGSLYATEDAATTDDFEETEDTISISSQNQRDLMQSMFLDSDAFAFLPETPDQAACTSLAVPEALVTTVSTADSLNTESVNTVVMLHPLRQLLVTCPPSALSSTLIHSCCNLWSFQQPAKVSQI
ncbi:unnamed protein product [Dicrocoelium dendriticum]|nr:unnamed protein product [Dicrocoelium dendriticum]